jgi:uncharacterized membrane protein
MDDIESLFFTIVIIAIGARYFITSNRFTKLRELIEHQGREIANLKRAIAALEARGVAAAPEPAATAEAAPAEPVATIEPPVVEAEQIPIAPPPEAALPPMPTAEPVKSKPNAIEQQFGGRAFVWVGGVALALAGFYLVKYSIDTGLLTEQVRVVLGVLFGAALLGGSWYVRSKPNVANGMRIAQALAGAGIADLYGSFFAATTLYHLVPGWLGFGAMAVTTAIALVLSLRHGAPIAALGLIGGYATPVMVQGSEPNAPLLFGYLYLVFAGLSVVSREKNWWWISVPTTLVAFAWVVLWVFDTPQDTAWLSTFLLLVGATSVFTNRMPQHAAEETALRPMPLLRAYLAPAGAAVLLGIVAYTANFGAFEWAMFGLFSAGAVGLAWFDDRTYTYLPWQAMAVNLAMLFGWEGAETSVHALTIGGFALLFAASGQIVLARTRNPLSWAALSATATVAYFLTAYALLNSDLIFWVTQDTADMLWAALAFVLAGAMTLAAARRFVTGCETALRHRLQATFAIAATVLISVGFAILLHQEYLSFALAAQVLAIAWIGTRVDIPALRPLAQAVTAAFAVSLVPEWLPAVANMLGTAPYDNAAELITSAIFRFGLPAAMLFGAAWLLRVKADDYYVKVLECGAAALITVTVYKLIQVPFLGHSSDNALAIDSIFTDVLLLMSFVALRAANWIKRESLFWSGFALAMIAAFRVIVLALVIENPLWSHQAVGTLPLLNGLLVIYALPALLIFLFGQELKPTIFGRWIEGVSIAAYLLGFFWLSLVVRQVFNGAHLDSGTIGNAEVYAYSVVWLAVGVALLFLAALRKDATMRFGSLGVMVLTVGKVFLYDASQLTGLWRVMSFLGLGLSLLALSWFYSRFIFVSKEPEAAA